VVPVPSQSSALFGQMASCVRVAGWLKIPVETTISRIFKEVTEKQISQLESVTHRMRAQIWRKANRAGVSKVGLNPVQWIDIDSTVDSVCGTQEGAAKGYNPNVIKLSTQSLIYFALL